MPGPVRTAKPLRDIELRDTKRSPICTPQGYAFKGAPLQTALPGVSA